MNFLISVRPNLPTRFHLMLWQVLINLSCDTIPFSPPAVKCVFHQASLILGWLKDPFVKKLTLVLNPDPCFSPVRQLFITNIVSSSFKQPVNEMRLSNRWSYKSGVWVEKLVIYPRFRGLLVQQPPLTYKDVLFVVGWGTFCLCFPSVSTSAANPAVEFALWCSLSFAPNFTSSFCSDNVKLEERRSLSRIKHEKKTEAIKL